ncbi:MAG: hypothetical protein JWL84_146 [Rhodospirillales bacterium]|nr:hypothetical protein [Rhodospirillales bacterium]
MGSPSDDLDCTRRGSNTICGCRKQYGGECRKLRVTAAYGSKAASGNPSQDAFMSSRPNSWRWCGRRAEMLARTSMPAVRTLRRDRSVGAGFRGCRRLWLCVASSPRRRGISEGRSREKRHCQRRAAPSMHCPYPDNTAENLIPILTEGINSRDLRIRCDCYLIPEISDDRWLCLRATMPHERPEVPVFRCDRCLRQRGPRRHNGFAPGTAAPDRGGRYGGVAPSDRKA